MLANGATLGYKAHGAAGDYTNLHGLKEIPEMGSDPEKVENTCLSDKVKQYDLGIGDAGEMSYKFKYDNSDGSSYRLMRAAEASKQVYDFREKLPDGTTYEYAAQVAVKRGGGGVNGVLEWTLTMGLQSEIAITDPTA